MSGSIQTVFLGRFRRSRACSVAGWFAVVLTFCHRISEGKPSCCSVDGVHPSVGDTSRLTQVLQGLEAIPSHGTWVGDAETPALLSRERMDQLSPNLAPAVLVAPSIGHPKPTDFGRMKASRRGVLLRSNVGLSLVRVRGIPEDDYEYEAMSKWRFATVSHLSIGYAWRSNFALTIDAFRLVVPHYPHEGQPVRFQLRVDSEVLGLGLGSTTFYPPLSLHWGQSVGYVLARVGGGIVSPPQYRGVGSLSFVGYELMRNERIGIVLAAQAFHVFAYGNQRYWVAHCFGMSLGVTYW